VAAASAPRTGLMWWIQALRWIEGTIVHRINRITRINRATARARRIRSRLRISFHASDN